MYIILQIRVSKRYDYCIIQCTCTIVSKAAFQIQAICQSLQDSSVLVQRHALELLLTGFPMHNSQLTRPDMVKIANATIKVVLRRDMSLNRRLYAWLLGTDANGTPLQVHVQE